MGIISILASVLTPSLIKAKRRARFLMCGKRQREIAHSVTLYSIDNNDKFPDSVATIGTVTHWNWSEPTMIIGYKTRNLQNHRSMSHYLRNYIDKAEILSCAGAPEKYKYLQDAWEAGDEWDNPETNPLSDPLNSNLCFYWNYDGYIEGKGTLFKGPRTFAGARNESRLVVSDYFGYDHWRSQKSFGSSERFKNAEITPGTALSSSYWSRSEDWVNLENITVKLQAAFADEHVEQYSAGDVVGMRAILDVKTGQPYPDGVGPGVFFVPRNSVR